MLNDIGVGTQNLNAMKPLNEEWRNTASFVK